LQELFAPIIDSRTIRQIPSLGLAHLGDAVYELLVRTWLVTAGTSTGSHLHRDTTALVNAQAQADAMDKILPLLTEEECSVYKRGRNADVRHIPKNASHAQYAKATGLEALFGYLYLSGQRNRMQILFETIMEGYHAA